MQIIRVKKDADFFSLEEPWNHLLEKSSNNNPFLTWDWLYTWWSCYKKGKELCILLLKEKDELLGIAPLYLCTKRIMGIPVRFLRIMGDEEVCSEYLDIIAREDKTRQVYSVLCEYLINRCLAWDVIFLSDFFKGTEFITVINRLSSREGLKAITRNVTINPYIILPETWEQYLSSLSKNRKRNVKRYLKKLDKAFEFSVGLYPDGFDITLEEAMSQMMSLHERRWRQKKQYGVFQRKRFRDFHMKVAEVFHNRGYLWLFFLWVNRKSLAALYGYRYKNKLYAYQMGFDPEMNKFGVGNAVLLLSIKHSIELSLKEYDFLRGESAYKYGLTEHERNNVAIHIFCNTLKGKLAHFYHLNKPDIKNWIKSKMPDKAWKYLSDVKYKRIMKR